MPGREGLLRAAARLDDILGRETSSKITFAGLVDRHLRLIEFPADVVGALEGVEINPFGVEQFAPHPHPLR